MDHNIEFAVSRGETLEAMGHEVTDAHDRAHAIASLAGGGFEAAGVELGLPVLDGYGVAGELRERLPTPPRLVAITGYREQQYRERSSLAGFHAHLVKPFSMADLIAAITA